MSGLSNDTLALGAIGLVLWYFSKDNEKKQSSTNFQSQLLDEDNVALLTFPPVSYAYAAPTWTHRPMSPIGHFTDPYPYSHASRRLY